MSPESLSLQLALEYVSCSIIKAPNEGFTFSKFEILAQPALLFELAQVTATKILPEASAICALLSSGLPIAVSTALAAKLPLSFFYRDGFKSSEANGLEPRLEPRRSPGANVVLIDSHDLTRFTSSVCSATMTKQWNIEPIQMLVPYSFDTGIDPTNTRELTYTSLGTFSDTFNTLATKRGIDVQVLQKLVTDPNGRFWDPLEVNLPLTADLLPPKSAHKSWSLKRLFRLENENSFISPYSWKLRRLAHRLTSSEERPYEFFLQPSFVAEFTEIANKMLKTWEYDMLVGVDLLGVAFAIALAYYCRPAFRGNIIAYLDQHHIAPLSLSLEGKKILPVEMSPTTGANAHGVYEFVKKWGGSFQEYFAVFPPGDPEGLFESASQISLRHLVQQGIIFRSLT